MNQEVASQADLSNIDSLVQAHRVLDEKVTELTEKGALTPEEDLELHRLKKEKLILKDRIEESKH